MKKIFLSYGHDQFALIARELAKRFEQDGYLAWYDPQLRIGGNYDIQLEEQIKSADFMLSLMTQHSMRENGVCLDEIALARGMSKSIIPIMVQKVNPPLLLCRLQYIDISEVIQQNPFEIKKDLFEQYYLQIRSIIEDYQKMDSLGVHFSIANQLLKVDSEVHLLAHQKRFIGRKWLDELYEKWLKKETDSRVFWLLGEAGSGKSAYVANLFKRNTSVIGAHLCRYDVIESIKIANIVRTMAFYLSTQIEGFQSLILPHLDEKNLEKMSHMQLFETLIATPLSKLPQQQEKKAFIIDGIDEIEALEDREMIIQLIIRYHQKLPKWFSLIITSRPEADIVSSLSMIPSNIIDLKSEGNQEDIRVYFQSELERLEIVVKAETIKQLVSQSEGVFLYAFFVINDLEMNQSRSIDISMIPRGLGGIYKQYFQRQFRKELGIDYDKDIRPLFELLCVTFETCSLEWLSAILESSNPLMDSFQLKNRYLPMIGSMIRLKEGYIELYHRSVFEWLISDQGVHTYQINPRKGHLQIAQYIKRNPTVLIRQPYFQKYGFYHMIQAQAQDMIKSIVQENEIIYFDSLGYSIQLIAIEEKWALLEGLFREMKPLRRLFNRIIYNLTNALINRGRVQFIERLLEELTTIGASPYVLGVTKVQYFSEKKQWDQATQYLDKVQSHLPNHVKKMSLDELFEYCVIQDLHRGDEIRKENYQKAMIFADEALETTKLILKKDENPYRKRELAFSISNKADIFLLQNDYLKAKTLYMQSNEILVELYEAYKTQGVLETLSDNCQRIGHCAKDADDFEEAVNNFQEAVHYSEKLKLMYPSITSKSNVALNYYFLASYQAKLDLFQDAQKSFLIAIELQQEVVKETNLTLDIDNLIIYYKEYVELLSNHSEDHEAYRYSTRLVELQSKHYDQQQSPMHFSELIIQWKMLNQLALRIGNFDVASQIDVKFQEGLKKLESMQLKELNQYIIIDTYLSLGDMEKEKENYVEAKNYYLKAKAYLPTSSTKKEPIESKEYQRTFLDKFASIAMMEERWEESVESSQKALSLAREIYKQDNGNQHMLVSSLANLSHIYESRGEIEHAIRMQKEILTLETTQFKRNETYNTNRNVTITMNDLADLYTDLNQTVKAEELYLQAIQQRLEAHSKYNHAVTAKDVLSSYQRIARFYHNNGHYSKAKDYYQRAISSSYEVYQSYKSPNDAIRWIQSMESMFGFLIENQNTLEAKNIHEQIEHEYKSLLMDSDSMTLLQAYASFLMQSSDFYSYIDQDEQANERYLQTISIRQRCLDSNPSIQNRLDYADALANWADQLRLLGRYIESLEIIQTSIHEIESIQPKTMRVYLYLTIHYEQKATILLSTNQYQKALEALEVSLNISQLMIQRSKSEKNRADLSKTYHKFMRFYLVTQQETLAIEYGVKALKNLESLVNEGQISKKTFNQYITSMMNLADVYVEFNRLQDAFLILQEAKTRMEGELKKGDSLSLRQNLSKIVYRIYEFYSSTQTFDRAEQAILEVASIEESIHHVYPSRKSLSDLMYTYDIIAIDYEERDDNRAEVYYLKTIETGKQIIKVSPLFADQVRLAKAYNSLAGMYYRSNQKAKTEHYLHEAAKFLEQLSSGEKSVRLTKELVKQYRIFAQFYLEYQGITQTQEAEALSIQALEQFQSIDAVDYDKELLDSIGEVYKLLIRVAIGKDDVNRFRTLALDYLSVLESGIEQIEDIDLYSQKGVIHYQIAVLNRQNKEVDAAIHNFQEAVKYMKMVLESSEREDSLETYFTVVQNFADFFLEIGKVQDTLQLVEPVLKTAFYPTLEEYPESTLESYHSIWDYYTLALEHSDDNAMIEEGLTTALNLSKRIMNLKKTHNSMSRLIRDFHRLAMFYLNQLETIDAMNTYLDALNLFQTSYPEDADSELNQKIAMFYMNAMELFIKESEMEQAKYCHQFLSAFYEHALEEDDEFARSEYYRLELANYHILFSQESFQEAYAVLTNLMPNVAQEVENSPSIEIYLVIAEMFYEMGKIHSLDSEDDSAMMYGNAALSYIEQIYEYRKTPIVYELFLDILSLMFLIDGNDNNHFEHVKRAGLLAVEYCQSYPNLKALAKKASFYQKISEEQKEERFLVEIVNIHKIMFEKKSSIVFSYRVAQVLYHLAEFYYEEQRYLDARSNLRDASKYLSIVKDAKGNIEVVVSLEQAIEGLISQMV